MMMAAMDDIGKFATHCADKFLVSQQGIQERYNLKLPRGVVEEFIKTVFYASMIPDEGRYPSVCLMSYRKGAERDFHFLFNDPLQPSAQEIAKLAHATDPESHVCCICDEGRILLEGIHVTVLKETREFGYSSSRVANPLKLLIRGPGHIEMSTGGIALVYKAGKITEENLFQYGDVMKRLVAAVTQELRELTTGKVEALEDIFNDLAKGIVKRGHGGILLVASMPRLAQFLSLRRVDCLLLQQLLVAYWDVVATLLATTGGAGGLLRSGAAGPITGPALAVASNTSMLEKCVESIARMSGMDGAIVMDYACKVAAFNAIIASSALGQVSPRLVDPFGSELEREAILKDRGSRHQSALSYASQVPNSFTFVISQDGGISAFHNPGDGTVLCEMGMRVLD
jgi:hypothetical protein